MRRACLASCVLASLATAVAASAAERLPPMALPFIRNVGQTHPDVRWHVSGSGPALHFTDREIVLVEPPGACGAGAAVRLRFVGASPSLRVEPLEDLPGVAHFYLGNRPEAWRERVPLNAGVAYRQAWPGIDATYRGTEGRLKGEFEVAPGADERQIVLEFSGIASMSLRPDGALRLTTESGELVEEAPIAWTESARGKRKVAASFVLLGENRVGFRVEGRDRSERLVIDPVLDYSSYLGGSGSDTIASILGGVNARDSDMRVAGSTLSPDFPTLSGAPPHAPANWDAFYAAYSLEASSIRWIVFVGGSADDRGVHGGGTTHSSDLPVSANAPQRDYAGNGDAFMVSLTDFGGLQTSTYVGGSQRDELFATALPCGGGQTWSTDFPTALRGSPRPQFDIRMDGPSDGFITCLGGATSDPWLRSTFIGGSGDDAVTSLAAASSAFGDLLAAGWTDSSDFPVAPGRGWDVTHGGRRDAFVVLMGNGFDDLASSTLVGGSEDDAAWDVASAPGFTGAGGISVVLVGETRSADFPLHRALQPALAGGKDAFITVLDHRLDVAYCSTPWGGSRDDSAVGADISASGVVTLAGTTESDDLVLMRPIQARLLGTSDGFVTRFLPGSTPPRLEWSTYLGSPGADVVTAASRMGDECLLLAGTTDSAEFPIVRAVQPLPGSADDAFVARICETDILAERDPSVQLVEVLERLERIEERLVGLDLTDILDALARLEECCGAASDALGDLLDFADDATARLDAIEDLLARLEAEDREERLRDIEESLWERRCVPWIWLPEAEGRLGEARAHVARRLDEALARGSRGVNEHVARARLDAADAHVARGEWQDACKRLSDAMHALTTP